MCITEELESLFVGQADDLHWKYHVDCPSTEDYMEMIDNSKSPSTTTTNTIYTDQTPQKPAASSVSASGSSKQNQQEPSKPHHHSLNPIPSPNTR